MGPSATPRSVYLARLRRAFLLQAHPDRFRSSDTQAQQARLVQELSNRMDQPDFAAWQRNDVVESSRDKRQLGDSLPFVLEKRDGSFVRTSLSLNNSVEEILASLTKALKEAGAAGSLPDPPQAPSSGQERIGKRSRPRSTVIDAAAKAAGRESDAIKWSRNNQGRDLKEFLSNSQQREEIQRRRSSRVDAQAAAMAVRRLYSFQAVDATTLGWSSAWVANLLRRLLELHQNHAQKEFKVDSFYPIRLTFANSAAKVAPEEGCAHILDKFGGVLRLSPAATSIEWREAFSAIDEKKISEIRYNQSRMFEFTKHIQSTFGVKLRKGYSCSNKEFFVFLERLSHSLPKSKRPAELVLASFALAENPLVVSIESSQMSRRPKVTREGKLQLGSAMDTPAFLNALNELGSKAIQRRGEHTANIMQQKQAIHQAQWQLGVQKVFATPAVSHDEFLFCVNRLLAEATRHDILQESLGGNSLGITGPDHFCHLADDGSLVIPHDWI